LLLRQQSTLGETLSGTPGVSSTYFGPSASRPIIRGLDGDRIRILENSGAMRDVSNLSYDHAVSIDPIAVERIEVLRGPGTLLYGGNAIGGVVNLIDNRIPRQPLQGVLGRADVSAASGSRERNGAMLVEGGSERAGFHVDAFDRSAGDTRVPIELACTKDGTATVARRICNSQGDARGGAAGGSMFFDKGYLGASFSGFRSAYGSPAEDEVRLKMDASRVALEGELRDLGHWVESVKLQGSSSRYRHTEFEGGAPGTTFRSKGSDARIEARHAKLGPLQGLVGLQLDNGRFSAQGDEAFAPPSKTRQRALFVYEELATRWGKFTFGGRREDVSVESFGNSALARFVPASRNFAPLSLSAGTLWNIAPRWQLTANLSRSERAPKDYELFANGPHVATGAYEVGDVTLGKERSASLDVGAQWKSGDHRAKLSVFQTRFSNYLALLATGGTRDSEGNGAGTGVADCGDGTSIESGCAAEILPEFSYRGAKARFSGLEAEGSVRLWRGTGTLDVEWRGDLVRADNLSTNEPLPRISPRRLGATILWGQGPWSAQIGFDNWARQARVPAGQTAVAGYTLWNAAVTYKSKAGSANLMFYARMNNLTDRLAYSATSILTQSAPGRVPLPGRSLRVGVRVDF
jgi:iron complex outermembrane receptor protein